MPECTQRVCSLLSVHPFNILHNYIQLYILCVYIYIYVCVCVCVCVCVLALRF